MTGHPQKSRILEHATQMEGVNIENLKGGLDCLRAMEEFKFNLVRRLNRFGVSKSRFFVLNALYYEPGRALTPAELADRIVLTRATITTCLDGLEKLGHIVRTPHPTDRRMTLIRLTESGQAYLEGFQPHHYRIISQIFSALTPEENRALVESLNKIRENSLEPPEAV